MYRYWTYASILAACLLVVAGPGAATPEIWGTGTAWLSDDPGFGGYWKYCYEIHWSGLPYAVSHIEILLCPGGCACACDAESFAFADTAGIGHPGVEEEYLTVHYYGDLDVSGDPSTGVEGMLLKFEPYEGICEPGREGSATLCFYSVAAPAFGAYPDHLSLKFGGEYALGRLDGAFPGCYQGFSPTGEKTWGYVKGLYR